MSNKIIYYLKPSSFCFGVERAIEMLEKIISENPHDKIYCIHEIVHNPGVVEKFEKAGIIFVNNIDEINETEVIVAFSAHGVNREILENANKKFKKVYNLECPLVTKVYKELESFKDLNTIFYIGKKGHQEAVGVEGFAKYLGKKVYLFSSISEIPDIDKDEKIGILSQTTLNFEYVKDFLVEIKKIYKNARLPLVGDICKATYERQSVIRKNLDKFETLIVIGGKESSNTKELYNIGKEAGKKSYFGEKLEDLFEFGEEKLFENDLVAVTGGASTPFGDIEKVYNYFVKNGYDLREINL